MADFYLKAVEGQKAVCGELLSVSWDINMEGSLVFKVLGEVSKANFRTSAVDSSKEYFLLFFRGSAWQDPMRGCPGGHRDPKELVDLQGQPLQSA